MKKWEPNPGRQAQKQPPLILTKNFSFLHQKLFLNKICFLSKTFFFVPKCFFPIRPKSRNQKLIFISNHRFLHLLSSMKPFLRGWEIRLSIFWWVIGKLGGFLTFKAEKMEISRANNKCYGDDFLVDMIKCVLYGVYQLKEINS